jgi:transcriptional regulator with XRE-family HTH domain
MEDAAWTLGPLLRRRRREAGLTVREAARRVGISPSYLVAIETSRNPTTGRPPVPSPAILAAVGRELAIGLDVLLAAATGAAPPVHVLLYQTDAAVRSAADAARHAFAAVDAWLDVAPAASQARDATGVLEAVSGSLAARPPAAGTRLGVLCGRSSGLLVEAGDPAAVLASEETWRDDVAARCASAHAPEPVANVCVYREADLRALGTRLDPVAAVLRLIRAHEGVLADDGGGRLASGPAASAALLAAARPAGVAADAWRDLCAAAAAGLGRSVPGVA